MTEAPAIDAPKPVAVHPDDAMIVVLDISGQCDQEGVVCHRVLRPIKALLDRGRGHGVRVAYTISKYLEGQPEGHVSTALERRDGEEVFFPNGFDKLTPGGGLLEHVSSLGKRELILCGSSTNVCVMYTATSAVRHHGLKVHIPVDCVNAATEYEHNYALHQITNLPPRVTEPVVLTASALMRFST